MPNLLPFALIVTSWSETCAAFGPTPLGKTEASWLNALNATGKLSVTTVAIEKNYVFRVPCSAVLLAPS